MGVLSVLLKALEVIESKPLILIPYFFVSFIGSFLFTISFITILVPDPSLAFPNNTITFLISLFFLTLITPLFGSAYSFMADQHYKGQKPSLAQAMNKVRQIYSKIIITSVLVNLLYLPILLVAIFILTRIGSISLGALLSLFLVFFFSALALQILLFLLYPVLVLENLGPLQTIKKCILLGQKNAGMIFKIFIAFGIINIFVSGIINLLGLSIPSNLHLIWTFPNSYVLSSVSQGLIGSWLVMVPVIFYNAYLKNPDQKRRSEQLPQPTNSPAAAGKRHFGGPGRLFMYAIYVILAAAAILGLILFAGGANLLNTGISVGLSPYPIVASASGAYVYVGNRNSSTISVINVSRNVIVSTIPVCLKASQAQFSGSGPSRMTITNDGRYLFAVCPLEVSVLNLSSGKLVGDVGFSGQLVGFASSQSGSAFYLTNSSSGSVLWILNTTSASPIYSVNLVGNFSALIVSATGKYVYETLSYSPKLLAINSATNQITQIPLRLNGTQYPGYLEISSDGKEIFASEGLGNIAVINSSNNKFYHTLQTGCTSSSSLDTISASPNPNYLYIMCGNRILFTNVTTGTSSPISLDATPYQVAFLASSTYAYVFATKNGGVVLYVLNALRNQIIATANNPSAITPDGKYLYTTNPQSNSVSVTKLS